MDNNFKSFFSSIVTEAQAQLETEQTFEAVVNEEVHNIACDVMNGYDNRYMTRNSYKVARKIRFISDNRVDNSTEFFDYLLQQYTGDNTAKVANRRQITGYEKRKVEKLTGATIKPFKKLPAATYIKEDKRIINADAAPNKDIEVVKILNHYDLQNAVIIEYQNTDIDKDQVDNRAKDEQHFTNYIVFVSNKFDANGRPNKFDGITQLRDWLKSMPFIQERKPERIKNALDILVGQTVQMPYAIRFNYSKDIDTHNVFKTTCDIDIFIEQYDECKHRDYQKISEYELRDKDEQGNIIPDEYEKITPESYMIGSSREDFDKRNDVLIKYECHKEFRQQLPIRYNHINAIFD